MTLMFHATADEKRRFKEIVSSFSEEERSEMKLTICDWIHTWVYNTNVLPKTVAQATLLARTLSRSHRHYFPYISIVLKSMLESIVKTHRSYNRKKRRVQSHYTILKKRFLVNDQLRDLGKGAYGSVVVALDLETYSFVAVKVLRPDVEDSILYMKSALHEVMILKTISWHENVARYVDSVMIAGKMNIMTDRVDGCNLFTSFSKIRGDHREADLYIIHVMIGIMRGLAVIHKNRIVHMDIKPENIVVEKHTRTPVIVDFGLSRIIQRDKKGGYFFGVTRYYRSPESILCMDMNSRVMIGTPTDVWSAACVFIHLLNGGTVCHKRGWTTDLYTFCSDRACSLLLGYDLWMKDLMKKCLTPHRGRRERMYEFARGVLREMLVYRPFDRLTAQATANRFMKFRDMMATQTPTKSPRAG